jgi:hypothetical protein
MTKNYRLLSHFEKDLGFIYHQNFMPADECDELVATFTTYQHLTFKTPTGDKFFDNRYFWMSSLPSTELRAKSLMQSARNRTTEQLREFFNDLHDLYADSVQLVKWPPGYPMPAHADNAHPSGAPHVTPHRKYASVVYLNDDYLGGELYIATLKLKIKPRKGLMIAFRGDFSHEHGVTAVESGMRYTMPAWYTDDTRRKDGEYNFDYEELYRNKHGLS